MQAPVDPRIPRLFSLFQSGQTAQAAALCAEVLQEQPHNAQARFVSALIDRQSGRVPQALATLETLAAQLPQNPAVRAELASTRVIAGRFDEALPALREIVGAQPNQPFGHFWLGQLHLRRFEGPEAVRCFERVRQLAPADLNILQPLGVAYISVGNTVAAEEALRQLIAAQPRNVEAINTLCAALEQQSRLREAGQLFRRALEIDPANGAALAGIARVLQTEGKRDEARRMLEPVLAAERVPPVAVSTYAGLCETSDQRRACIAAARSRVDDPTLGAQDRASLCFALGRLLDAERDYDAAFEAYRKGNDLFPKLYRPQEKRQLTDQLIRTFSASALRSLPRAERASERPVFVLGMPRSGTTLIEQILGAHPGVHAAGELSEMRRIWRDLLASVGRGSVSGLANLARTDVNAAALRYLNHLDTLDADAPRVTDKMPHNFELLGLINLLFPSARVIHCVREPLDTCISCYTIQFSMAHTYATDLAHLGHAYGEYARLMRHWREALDMPLLEVVYEDVVADIEGAARRIVEFVGLPWDERCLRYYEAERAVVTASVDQVRKPVYSSSVARWKRYEKHLGPLADALRAAGVDVG